MTKNKYITLEKINSPKDLKNLSKKDKKEVKSLLKLLEEFKKGR